MSKICWKTLSDSIAYYRKSGYAEIDVPWCVSRAAIATTYTGQGWPGLAPGTGLVGSAEQGVIQMVLDGTLSPGRYVSCTPCFREDEPDDTHVQTFMKVELSIVTTAPTSEQLDSMIAHAREWFIARSVAGSEIQVVQTGERQYDIEKNSIEIGSYGIRENVHAGMSVIYGTGIALPRFFIAEQPIVSSHAQ